MAPGLTLGKFQLTVRAPEFSRPCIGKQQIHWREDMKMKLMAAAVFIGGVICTGASAQSLAEVTTFGTNPGNLRMFKYVPQGLPANAPLVVALHGCTQSASAYDDEPGWTQLAETEKFALLLPEQKSINNSKYCFNWFLAEYSKRDQGETLSIKQMIDKMLKDHGLDTKRVFVTGLSAGGAMTAVMLASYPEVFAGGAVVAGLPYQCTTTTYGAFSCMNPGKNQTPAQWGQLVRAASTHTGPWPRVSIWHGTADTTVAPINAQELVDQWTNVHGIDQTPDGEETVNGHSHRVYKDAGGNVKVESYLISNMSHGTPIATTGAEQCGKKADYILDAGICSSRRIAQFWGIAKAATNPTPNPTPNPAPGTADIDALIKQVELIQQTAASLKDGLEKAKAQK
jgi:poly(hydroxyalkanoate) depolymerase family esterase